MIEVPLRVAIADDSVLLRDGLVRLLSESGFEVVAAVGDAAGLLDGLADTAADLEVVDVPMPPTFTDEGIQAALSIRERWPALAIVVLSQYVEERYAADLLGGSSPTPTGRSSSTTTTGGVGYLLKDRVVDIDDFVSSLRRVAAGGSAVDAEVVSQLLGRSRKATELDRLTPREREVLEAMAEGLSNAGIAAKLTISHGAVEKHISNVFAKLDLEPVDNAHRRVLAVLAYLER